jgi:hypothetical protein
MASHILALGLPVLPFLYSHYFLLPKYFSLYPKASMLNLNKKYLYAYKLEWIKLYFRTGRYMLLSRFAGNFERCKTHANVEKFVMNLPFMEMSLQKLRKEIKLIFIH